MRVLDFKVVKQDVKKEGDFSGLIAGTKGYLKARFSFSSEWGGYKKIAVFTCQNGEYRRVIDVGLCNIPDEVTECGSFKLHVLGVRDNNSTIMSNRITIIQRRH